MDEISASILSAGMLASWDLRRQWASASQKSSLRGGKHRGGRGDSRASPLPCPPQCRHKKGQVCTHHCGLGGGSLPGSGDSMQCKSFL